MPCALMYSFKQKNKYEHVLGAKTENFWMHFPENNS